MSEIKCQNYDVETDGCLVKCNIYCKNGKMNGLKRDYMCCIGCDEFLKCEKVCKKLDEWDKEEN